MCGVMGWVDWSRDLAVEQDLVKSMVLTLSKRGPDSEGIWFSRHAVIGHRRLAVLDIEKGNQPMVKKGPGGEPCVLTFAGEIYNAQELRNELQSLGHVFTTRSDTEVLLHTYLEWHERSVDRLNGMFAFGIWDGDRQELFLARDRLGVKPLFYAELPNGLIFGSEPKVLLQNKLIPSEVTSDGLAEIFVMGLMRTPGHGIYSRINELRPGFTLLFGRSRMNLTRYWQLSSRPHEDDKETTKIHLRNLVEDAVCRQLIADVPVCTMLSGGLDSSIITAVAARQVADAGHNTLHSYSVNLENEADHFHPSELQPDLDQPWVERAFKTIGTLHHTITVTQEDLIENFLKPLFARDLPSMGDRDTSFYLLCRAIKGMHTVALSGESADELFGGYPWFHDTAAHNRNVFPWHASADPGMVRYLNPEVIAYIHPVEYEADRLADALAEVPMLEGEGISDRRMREIHYLNQTRFLLALLDRKDRISMCSGVEVRVPFCDHRIVEYAWNIPWEMKIAQSREKGLLREAFEHLLPTELLWRRKSAYPVTHDPVYCKTICNLLLNILDDPCAPIRPLLDINKLRDRLKEEPTKENWKSGHTSIRVFVDLLQVNAWLGQYKVVIR